MFHLIYDLGYFKKTPIPTLRVAYIVIQLKRCRLIFAPILTRYCNPKSASVPPETADPVGICHSPLGEYCDSLNM